MSIDIGYKQTCQDPHGDWGSDRTFQRKPFNHLCDKIILVTEVEVDRTFPSNQATFQQSDILD